MNAHHIATELAQKAITTDHYLEQTSMINTVPTLNWIGLDLIEETKQA
jgi:hypothetical protein